jgi:Uma2 family endonuclease
MASAAVKPRVSAADYLALERPAETKHEYRDGEVVAMSGAKSPHILIVGNLLFAIKLVIRGGGCQVYSNDLRVAVDPEGFYTYPDLVAISAPPQFLDNQLDTLLNPCVIVEVLSPSTEAYDRGEKFTRYQQLETLREYVVVAQDRIWVELHERAGEEWVRTILSRREDVLHLGSIGCDIPVEAIYEGIELPAAGD